MRMRSLLVSRPFGPDRGLQRAARIVGLMLTLGFVSSVLIAWMLAVVISPRMAWTPGPSWTIRDGDVKPAVLESLSHYSKVPLYGSRSAVFSFDLSSRIGLGIRERYWDLITGQGREAMDRAAPARRRVESWGLFTAWKLDPDHRWGALANHELADRIVSAEPAEFGSVPRFGRDEAVGFPFLCLWSSTYFPFPGLASSPSDQVTIGGIVLSPAQAANPPVAASVLPYRPLWLGLGANTAIWAVVLWFAFGVLRTLRRSRRVARGRCPACSYNLLFEMRAGCPECGWGRA